MRMIIPVSAALVLLLAGCASPFAMSSPDGGGQTAPDVAAPDIAPQDGDAASQDQSAQADAEQALIVTAWVELVGEDPVAISEDVVDLANASGGLVESRVDSAGTAETEPWASITVRVPADALEAVIDDLGDLGDVRGVEIGQVDVTQQVRDLDVRIESLQASVARLQELLASAADTQTLLEVEAALTERTAELESLLAEQAYLQDQVSMSTLTVEIDVPAASPEAPANFIDGLGAGWQALVAFVGALGVATGAALPWLAVLALLAIVVVAIVRRARSRRQASTADPA